MCENPYGNRQAFRRIKTSKLEKFVEKVIEAYEEENPYEFHSSVVMENLNKTTSIVSKNKTHLNVNKEKEEIEYTNLDKIFALVHKRFKYPNETLKKTLSFFGTQTPYKDHEDYAQDFILYIMEKQDRVLFMDLDDESLFKLTNSALRNYLIEVSKSFSKSMMPLPKWGLNWDEWEFFYLNGSEKPLNKKHMVQKEKKLSQFSASLIKSIIEKLKLEIDNKLEQQEVCEKLKESFKALEESHANQKRQRW